MQAVLNSFQPAHMSTASLPRPPNPGILHSHEHSVNSLNDWFYTSMSFSFSLHLECPSTFMCCLKMPAHLSRPRSNFFKTMQTVVLPTTAPRWAACCSFLCAPLPLIGWQSSPLSLRTEKCVSSLLASLLLCKGHKKGTQNI